MRGCDIDGDDIANARESIRSALGVPMDDRLRVASVYDLDEQADCAPLIVCCEVLEHLADPGRAMEKIAALAKPYFIIAVPREPIWCIMNLCMLRNVKTLGNTPGHINHWSKRGFVSLAKKYGEVLEVRSPFPFTMLLCKKREGLAGGGVA